MNQIETEIIELEKLVNNGPVVRRDTPLLRKRLTKLAEPHIRPHNVKGRKYYYYCRGNDNEIYLGNADHILKCCQGIKKVVK